MAKQKPSKPPPEPLPHVVAHDRFGQTFPVGCTLTKMPEPPEPPPVDTRPRRFEPPEGCCDD
jgi:hypothetical protein